MVIKVIVTNDKNKCAACRFLMIH